MHMTRDLLRDAFNGIRRIWVPVEHHDAAILRNLRRNPQFIGNFAMQPYLKLTHHSFGQYDNLPALKSSREMYSCSLRTSRRIAACSCMNFARSSGCAPALKR